MLLHKIGLLALIGLSLSANANLMHVKGKSGGKSKSKVSRSYKGKSSSNKRSFAGSNTGQYSCGKRLCGQMNSCAEARFHLTQCNVKSLDRDRDGIPCESLCGG